MLNTEHFTLLAGDPTAWDNEVRERCQPGKQPGTFASADLCQVQVDQARRGRLEAELVRSVYGWTVRYASGLQGRAIIYRTGEHSPALALKLGREWVDRDPANRSMFVRKYEVERCERDGYNCDCLKVANDLG